MHYVDYVRVSSLFAKPDNAPLVINLTSEHDFDNLFDAVRPFAVFNATAAALEHIFRELKRLRPDKLIFAINGVEEFKKSLAATMITEDQEKERVVVSLLGGILVEVSDTVPEVYAAASTNAWFALILSREMASYETWRINESYAIDRLATPLKILSDANQRFVDLMARSEKTANRLSADLKNRKKPLDALNKEMEAALLEIETVRSQSEDLLELLKLAEADTDRIMRRADESEKHIAATVDAVAESALQNAGREMWDKRAKAATWNFRFSGVALILLLAVLPGIAIHNYEWVIDLLMKINAVISKDLPPDPTAAQLTMASLNRLLVIAAPLVLYLWMVRIIVRLNMHSLVLADDAHQRRTIMDTYIHMIEKQIAQREDRALLLNAIFRPPPGQVNDSVEPPNFAELLEKMK